ncbi:hypothetical protein AB6C73_26155 [Vibrio splendidus]
MKSTDKFIEALYKEDDVGCVIYTHIHVESLIIKYLDIFLPESKFIKEMRLDYFQKVHLSLALGFPIELKGPLLGLGKARNNFAHRLDQKIDANFVNNFYKTFSKEHQSDISSQAVKNIFKLAKTWKDLSPKDKFIDCCNSLHSRVECVIIEHSTEKDINEISRVMFDVNMAVNKIL